MSDKYTLLYQIGKELKKSINKSIPIIEKVHSIVLWPNYEHGIDIYLTPSNIEIYIYSAHGFNCERYYHFAICEPGSIEKAVSTLEKEIENIRRLKMYLKDFELKKRITK